METCPPRFASPLIARHNRACVIVELSCWNESRAGSNTICADVSGRVLQRWIGSWPGTCVLECPGAVRLCGRKLFDYWFGGNRFMRTVLARFFFLALKLVPLFAVAMMTGGCAYGLYLHGNGGLSEKELSEVPTLAVMSPEKYRELMGGEPEKREAGKAIEVQGPGFLDPVNGWGGRFDFHPLYAYQQPDGKIDCDVSFAQSSPQNADYWLVIRTDNGLSLSDNMWIPEMLPSGILAIFTFTLFPVIDNSEVSMPYTVYAAESPEEINSEGAVSMKYVAVQHYLEHFNHITPDARRQVASSKKAICALLRKAVKDAEDNYSFF